MRKPRRLMVVVSVIALAVLGVVVLRSRLSPASARPTRKDNLLLITLDTTRADRLGCYGYQRARTRYLDRLAAEGVRFESAFAQAPITLPSHVTLFTGLNPPSHGVRNNGNFYLGPELPTLATQLKAQGYRTAAFVSSFILDRRYGLARGFDLYDDAMQGAQAQVVTLEAERRGDRTALALSRWMETNAFAPSPFFAWLHLFDAHEPYRPPPPFREMFADSPYDGAIAFDDAIVASVLDALSRAGQRERTLIAVIGDHGESLGDHGEETHSMFVYEAAIRVPFLLWRPGIVPAGVVVKPPVRGVDLAPTLLELLGVPPLPKSEGRSLTPLFNARAPEPAPAVYTETYLPQFYMNWAPLRAVRDERYKLIDAPRPELYDLARDPEEQHNLYQEQPERVQSLRRKLDALTGVGPGSMSVGALDREATEKLAALGYVGAGAHATSTGQGEDRPDPKQMIAVFNRLRRANTAVRDRRYGDALPILREVLTEDPKNAFAQLVLGSAFMGMGDSHRAVAQFRSYLSIVPASAYAHLWIAICLARLGDRDGALREAAATLAIDPRFSDARVLRAGVLASRGDHPAAIAELRQAIATDPAKPLLHLDLAKVLAEAGQVAEAEAEYRALLGIRPDDPPALIGLSVLRAKAGALDEAARGLRRALELEPRHIDARFDLAEVLERQHKRAQAIEQYRRVVASPAAAENVRDAARRRLAALGS